MISNNNNKFYWNSIVNMLNLKSFLVNLPRYDSYFITFTLGASEDLLKHCIDAFIAFVTYHIS